MRYAMFPAGKRIRPLLCIAAYRANGGRADSEILPFACGIESIHAFSLIQDDLPCMDDDRERRGQPTLHIAFGEANALLASDALFSLAFEMFTRSTISSARRVRAIREIAAAVGSRGIVEGQIHDIDPAKSRDARTLRRIHRLKTARLIAASFAVGAIAAGADQRTIRDMSRSGLYLGMLFQITDDLLDEKQEAGNPNSFTYLGFYGRDYAQFLARRYRAKYESELDQLKDRLTRKGLCELREVGSFVQRRRG
jgi:geranylgeranyl pyrophosphate synthase